MKPLEQIKSRFKLYSTRSRTTRRSRPALEEMETRLVPATPPWTAIGPAPIFGDQLDAPESAKYAVSGRVTAIVVDPSDPTGNTVYIGTAGGGVWMGTNINTDSAATPRTWTPLTDNLATQINDPLVTLTVGAVAAVSNPSTSSTILYAGLGEPNAISTVMIPGKANSQFYGTGIIKSIDGGQNWTLLGGSGASNIFYRSAISKIVVSPSNPNLVYAAVASAKNGVTGNEGIWKSTDGGLTWTNTTKTAIPGSNQYMFTDLVMPDSNNPDLLFAAIGEQIGSVFNGVYETTNGGASWFELTNLPNGAQQNNLEGVGRITLAASSNIGTAAAPQYQLYAAFMANNLTQNASIVKEAKASDKQVVGDEETYTVTVRYTGFAGLEFFKADQDVEITGLGEGFDGTFQIDSVGTSEGTAFLKYKFTTTVGTPLPDPVTDPQGATAQAPFGTLYQLGYVTVTGAAGDVSAAWNVIPGFDLPSVSSGRDYVGGGGSTAETADTSTYQGYYGTTLIVVPSFVGEDHYAGDHIYAGGQDYFLSVEKATSVTPVVKDLASKDVSSGTPIHVDHHGIAIAPTTISSANSFTVLDGSDGGVYEYDPTGNSWTDLNYTSSSDLNKNLQISQFFGIQVNPTNPAQILGGVQDNGSIFTTDGGQTWTDLTLQQDPQKGGGPYTGGDGGQVYLNSTGTIGYVINTGKLQNSTSPFGSERYNFIGGTGSNTLPSLDEVVGLFPNEDYLMSPGNPQTLWLGTNTIYMTTDGGSNWFPITTFDSQNQHGWFTPFNTIQNGYLLNTTVVDSMAAPATNASMLYVGARGGHFLVTTNVSTNSPTGANPVTWVESDPIPVTSQNQAQLADLKFSDIQIDPSNPNIVFVTAANFGDVTGGAHVWMGVFNPATMKIAWSNISGNLPNVPAWSVEVQELSPGDLPVLYVGTDVGVFCTTNLGASWSRFGSGLPNVQARALSLNVNVANPSQNVLLVGTLGRGAYQVTPNIALTPTPTSFIQSVYFHLMGRSADAEGLAAWTQVLDTLGNTPAGRTQVVMGIEQNPAYLNQVVTGLYEHYLNRAPDPGAQGWVTALANGATTIENVIAALVSSPEFFTKAGGTNSGFLNAVYTSILGRAADSSGFTAWLNALDSGTSRTTVAPAFLTSMEYRQNLVAGLGWTPTGNPATPGSYFQGYYLAYLGRQGDPTGVASWVAELQGGVTDQMVIAGILGGPEFYGNSV